MKFKVFIFIAFVSIQGCDDNRLKTNQLDKSNQNLPFIQNKDELVISRDVYLNKLYGFWLGQSIANWTGRITEMDKIGGDGPYGVPFYTRDDWGKIDLPNRMGRTGVQLSSGEIFDRIDWALEDQTGVWGSDDDTDIEYIYQHLLLENQTSILSGEQIRDGWVTHIYSDENTPFTRNGRPENWLWVSNQAAHDLMLEKEFLPPATSDPENNFFYDMIDAQLTTEIFGLFAPGRPEIALEMAHLPIRVTAFENAEWIAKFYVEMHSLASLVDQNLSLKEQTQWMAKMARLRIPNNSYSAKMFDFVMNLYKSGVPWEQARDEIYIRYQVNQLDGYEILSTKLLPDSDPNSDNGFYQSFVNCYGCFAAGINFAASIISLLYGEGDFQETIKIATLAGWDSDNPAATWGGLIGFIIGKKGIENAFNQTFSNRYNIHRTRGGFPNNGIDNFHAMAEKGLLVIDRVVEEEMDGRVDIATNQWYIPIPTNKSYKDQ
ncbi:MAG: heme biosynthesis protein HemY [Gammaproteobacteria bacterium]|nr:heme biosynthesis protein HemY [Gammaproteobacteria bacterium]|tara:strand:+ start:5059 stop:6525 length:1467 start_codon:yes stop_codon:yes gene_type:complete